MSDLENAFTMLAADADLADQRACPQDARINATQDKKSPRQSDHAPEIERDVADCPLPEPFNGASGTFLQSPDPDPSRAIVKLQPPSPRLPSSAASTAADTATHELQPPLRPTKPWHFCVARLREDVHKDDAIMPLTWQAFLTGLVDSMIYASAEVWVGFVTGDFVQLSMNLANFIIPHKPHEGLKMLLRGMAIVGFFLGSMVAGRVGKQFGWHSRGWLVLSSVMQCLLLWIAAGIQLSRPKLEQPNWHWWPPTIIMASMSMGMQSTTSQQLASPAFATSVAFTATVSQIAADPHLFKLWPPLTREIRDRDLRVLSLMALCFGAGVGQSLLDTDLRFSGSLAICAACKTVLAVIWWLPQGQPVQPRRPSRRER